MKHPARSLPLLTSAAAVMMFSLSACGAGGTQSPPTSRSPVGEYSSVHRQAAPGDHVPVIEALERKGLEILGRFDAPRRLSGFAAEYRGEPVAIYVMPGGQYAVIGTLIDARGRNLSAAPLERLVAGSEHAGVWTRLKNSTWIADGSDEAGRTIYMFFDANCPYCHKFWKMSRPWVKAGRVQIRQIPVAILKRSSLPKAAAMLLANDPSAAFTRHESTYEAGGIDPVWKVPSGIALKIRLNNRLMRTLGSAATPTIFWRAADGEVKVTRGVPGHRGLVAIMGSPEP